MPPKGTKTGKFYGNKWTSKVAPIAVVAVAGKKSKKKPRSSHSGVASFKSVFKSFAGKDPFPPRKTVDMVYNASSAYQCGVAGVLGVQQSWRLNSLYDPDETGVGHQPYGFDQMALLYKIYKVTNCKVEITIDDPSEDGLGVAMFIANPANASDFITGESLDKIGEKQQGMVCRINDSGSQLVKKSFNIPIRQVSGYSSLQFRANDGAFTALVGGNPADVPRLLVAVGSYRGSSNGTVIITTRLTFTATFSHRVVLAQS